MSYLYVLLNISMLMMNFGSQNENEKENTCGPCCTKHSKENNLKTNNKNNHKHNMYLS